MPTAQIDDLVSAVRSRLDNHDPTGTPLLIAIDGAGGAGKSTFAGQLAALLRAQGIGCEIVHMDDFYHPSSVRQTAEAQEEIGGDFDWQRLRDQVLVPLRTGRPARYPRYDWHADALGEWHPIPDQPVILIEGVYVLRRELRPLYDLTVWIECPRPERLARGVDRDGEEARSMWEQTWMPQEDCYVDAHKPRQSAHYVFRGDRPEWR